MLVKPQSNPVAKIRVVGVGGAGGNVVNTMVQDGSIRDVEFVAVNTDAQALQVSKADTKVRIGDGITRGLGSGGNPIIGRKAAEESMEVIHEHLAGSDMVFITAGMGGGTGTGAAPIVGEVAKNQGALTIAVVMKPFHFEGQRRMEAALKGIDDLRQKVDTMIVIPNQRLLEVLAPEASFSEAMLKSDEVMLQAVKSIADLCTQTGLINVDFADVRSIMDNAGTAMMGIGRASGEERSVQAAIQAIESPLLEVRIDGATGVLLNIVGGKGLRIHEVDEAARIVGERVAAEANIIFGARIDETLQDDEVTITVIATGFADDDGRATASIDPFKLKAARTLGINKPQGNALEMENDASKLRGNLFGNAMEESESAGSNYEAYDDEPSYLRRKQSQ